MKFFQRAEDAKKYLRRIYGRGKGLSAQLQRYENIASEFMQYSGKKGFYLGSAGGRIEIVGNHTDHNGGKVLSAAINPDIAAAFLPADDGVVRVRSRGYRDIEFSLDEVEIKEQNSRGMLKGVLDGFRECGYNIGGVTVYMDSNVPSGAGISSSAAFEVLFAQIQNHLYNGGKVSPVAIAEISCRAENVYFNKPSGLLDQATVALGGAVKLDFSGKLRYRRIETHLHGIKAVLVNSGGSHSKFVDLYAEIPHDMKSVAAFFGKDRLIEVDEKQFFDNYDKVLAATGGRQALRAKHFFEENKRVDLAAHAMENGETEAFFNQINSSGQSSETQLRNCSAFGDTTLIDAIRYCKEADSDGAVRVHGGGFAGTVLCFVKKSHAKKFVAAMRRKFGYRNVLFVRARRQGAVVL